MAMPRRRLLLIVLAALLAGGTVLMWSPAAEAQEPRHEVTGTVVDESGRPVADVFVAAQAATGRFEDWVTRAPGTFRLQLPDGPHQLWIRSNRFDRCIVSGIENPERRPDAVIRVAGNDIEDLRIVVRASGPPQSTRWVMCEIPPETITTELIPGWNLAGWTGDEAEASELFGAIPGLEVVHAWNAEEERFLTAAAGVPDEVSDLRTLTPGMGLWLYVGGTDPVDWTRDFLPESGLVSLLEGWNLVAWSGEDDASRDEALALLDPDIQQDGSTQRLKRGDGVWVRVASQRYWLQPGSAGAEVEFSEEYSDDRQDELGSLVDTAVAYFAHRFGVVVPGVTARYRSATEEGCFYSRRTLFLKELCYTAVGHEYSHAIQEHLAGPGSSPVWILEGVANRWSAQFHEARGFRTYANHLRDTVHPQARRTLTSLEDLEASLSDGGLRQNYNLIHVAIDFLVELVGEDRTFEYYRERPNYRTWQDAFHGTFGLSVDDFYSEFAEYRAANFAPFEGIQGIAETPDSEPLGGLWLGAFPLGEADYLGASTAADGTFTLRVPDGAYHLQLHTADASTCTVGGYEPGVAGRQAIIRVDGEGVSGVRILAGGLPSDEAVWIPCTFAE